MENEDEFEQQISNRENMMCEKVLYKYSCSTVQQLEEEALMQQCIEAMQDEMNAAGNAGYQNGNGHEDILSCSLQNLSVSQSDDNSSQEVCIHCNSLKMSFLLNRFQFRAGE